MVLVKGRLVALLEDRRLDADQRTPVIRTGLSASIVLDSVARTCSGRQAPAERQSSLSVVSLKLTRTRKSLRMQQLDQWSKLRTL
jgi:hypothetical protein